ncbi:MAG: Bacterial leucyl aminopeptidase precursor [Syntrophorhabdus sp. PtaU1.Bin153]|nr:MAG: Bacterial leucyl aminopeptidase precursor [Syntrophorhabdus sp. PtaU1.Bin153]
MRFALLLFMCMAWWGQSVFAAPQDIKSFIPVKKERLKTDVQALASITPARNYRNVPSLNRSADYILAEFQKLDCAASIQNFAAEDHNYKNVICSFGRKDAERIIVGAHYDVHGNTPGADDNGSGVAGLLELARLINETGPALKHRIDLVAYSLEEPPFFRTDLMGSYIHARSLYDGKVKVKAMICLESIGYFSDEPASQFFPAFFFRWFYPDRGNFVVVVGKWGQGDLVRRVKNNMSRGSGIHVDSIVAPPMVPGVDLSDHLSYWKFGFGAVMVTDTAFYRNPHYHEPTDTIDTLDFDRMAEVVKGLYRAVLDL